MTVTVRDKYTNSGSYWRCDAPVKEEGVVMGWSGGGWPDERKMADPEEVTPEKGLIHSARIAEGCSGSEEHRLPQAGQDTCVVQGGRKVSSAAKWWCLMWDFMLLWYCRAVWRSSCCYLPANVHLKRVTLPRLCPSRLEHTNTGPLLHLTCVYLRLRYVTLAELAATVCAQVTGSLR